MMNEKIRYIVPMSLWFVASSQRRHPWGMPCAVVVVAVIGVPRGVHDPLVRSCSCSFLSPGTRPPHALRAPPIPRDVMGVPARPGRPCL